MLETVFPNGIATYVLGGLLVGIGISSIYIFTGRITGASAVFTSTWSYILKGSFFQEFAGNRSWRLVLVLGTLIGGFLYYQLVAGGEATVTDMHPLRLFIAGLFIGVGSRIAGGCTSGHGICGSAFFERDSMTATALFVIFGMITALITSQWL